MWNIVKFGNFYFTNSYWAIKLQKHPQTFVVWKVKVHLIIVTKWLKQFCLCCKNFNDQARSVGPKREGSEAMPQLIEANPVSRTWRVSGELSISPSIEVCHFHNLNKYIQSCWNVPHVLAKYCKTFDSSENFISISKEL